MDPSLGLPELLGSGVLQSLLPRPSPPAPGYKPRPETLYRSGQSPLETSLVFFPFLDGLLAQLTTLDILRFTNVSQTVRYYTYTHNPSFRVLNLVRFCQEVHRFLPNNRPHNATNKLRNWEYNPSAKKYPYIDTNEWECSCKFCVCYERLHSHREGGGFGREFFQREYYYYNHLDSVSLSTLFKRLPDGMQLTVLILDGTDVDMGFVKEIFKSAWGGAWLKELSLRRCSKIEHSGVEKWLKAVFSRNWTHGLRVLKLWGCGTVSPHGSFRPCYGAISPPAGINIPGPGDHHINNPDETSTTQANSIGTSHATPAPIILNASASSPDAQAGAWSNNPTIFGSSTIDGPGVLLQNPPAVGTESGSFRGTGIQTPIPIHLNSNIATNVTTQGPDQNTINPLGSASATIVPVLNSPNSGMILAGTANDQDNASNRLLDMSQGLAGGQNSDINSTNGSGAVSDLTTGVGTAGSGQIMMHPEHPGSNSIENSTPNNLLSSVSGVLPTPPVATSAPAPTAHSTRIADPTINLIRFCRQKKINLDIGLCVMKQQCFTLRAHEDVTAAQNLLAAVGGIVGFAPHQSGRVVLAQKRPAKRECCQEECRSVELEALCGRCVANMTCQKCSNFYCRKHDTGEHLNLLCAICGPCCDTCFEANTTSCTQCDEHFCNTHYPNGRCLIAFDLITGDLVAREEDDVIAEEDEEGTNGGLFGDTLGGRRNRKYESCKSCNEVTCWECTDDDGWEYCNATRGGCGEMVCDSCVLLSCGLCGSRLCEYCMNDMDGNHSATTDSYGNPINLNTSGRDNDDWLCGNCYKSRQAEIKKHRDMDPFAMRALFGEKFSLGEIREVLEKDDMETANKEGWLKCMLDEADYDMPDLIDLDDDNESMPDLVDSDYDEDTTLGLGGGVDDMPGLIDSDRSYGGPEGNAPVCLSPGRDAGDAGDRHLAMQNDFGEVGLGGSRRETKDFRAKPAFEGPGERGTRDHEKVISPDKPSCRGGVEASPQNTGPTRTVVGAITRGQTHVEDTSGEKNNTDVESRRDQSSY